MKYNYRTRSWQKYRGWLSANKLPGNRSAYLNTVKWWLRKINNTLREIGRKKECEVKDMDGTDYGVSVLKFMRYDGRP
jgi:hypothetical protein